MYMQKQIYPYGDGIWKRNNDESKGKWKSHKKRIGKFCNYCKKLCEQSLITGFPVIASSRSLLRKGVKSTVFVVCMCGFLYQTSAFLRMYWLFPTMVDIQIQNLDNILLPAVSVCNQNRIRRKTACQLVPEGCTWYDNKTYFCNLFPKYCSEYDMDPVLASMGFRNIQNTNRSLEYLQQVGQRKEDFIAKCKVQSVKSRICKNYVEIPAVDSGGNPNFCFTIESLWGYPQQLPETIPITGQVSLVLNIHPEEYINNLDLAKAFVEMHEPRAISNPLVDGITLYAGKVYNIYVNEIMTIRLPAPYKTNCTDYKKLWKEKGGYGPMNGKACAENCKVEATVRALGCVPQSVTYPRNYTTCSDSSIYPPDNIVDSCSKNCQDACEDVSYNLRVELKDDPTQQCKPNDEYCKNRIIFASIIFSGMKLTTFRHEPKYESIEVFSYIGGYMGMWLGISLVALFDFFETLGYLLYYPCKKKRTRKTNSFIP